MALSKDAKVGFYWNKTLWVIYCRVLISAGYDVTVYNRTPEKAQKLVSLNSRCRGECCKRRGVMLYHGWLSSDVEDVYLATDGLIRVAKKNAYLIDLTTSSSNIDIHDAAGD